MEVRAKEAESGQSCKEEGGSLVGRTLRAFLEEPAGGTGPAAGPSQQTGPWVPKEAIRASTEWEGWKIQV